MNEKLQYATMLEIPVSTCSVTRVPTKKRRRKRKKEIDPDVVKEELLSKINSEEESAAEQTEGKAAWKEEYDRAINELDEEERLAEEKEGLETVENEATANVYPVGGKEKKRFKISAIGAQLAVIGALVAVIFLTNAFYADSGINVFFKSVFGGNQTQTADTRGYEEFAPVIATGGDAAVAVDDGVMTFSGAGSIYAPCDGTVSSLSLGEDGKYTMVISHSENFKTVLSGIDFAYAGLDEEVFYNIPVGYVAAGGATMCFTGENGAVISDYELVGDAIVWAV